MRSALFAAAAIVGLLLGACGDASPPDANPGVATAPGGRVAARHGVSVGLREIGRSVEGRAIEAVTVGTGKRTVVVIGGLHTGNEDETVDLVTNLSRAYSSGEHTIPDGLRLIFIPEANPDGLANGERTNANGVDLNRNWPTEDWAQYAFHGDAEVFGGQHPLSEPETAALYDYVVGIRPEFVLSFHGYAGVVHHNTEADAANLGEAFAEAAEYEPIGEWDFYPITGELIEGLAEAGIAAADVELWESDDMSFDRALAGLQAVLEEIA